MQVPTEASETVKFIYYLWVVLIMGLKYQGRFPYHLAFTKTLFTEDALNGPDKLQIRNLSMDVLLFGKYSNGIFYEETGRYITFDLSSEAADTDLFPVFWTPAINPPQPYIPFTPRLLYANDTLGKLKNIFKDLRDEEESRNRSGIIQRPGWHVEFVFGRIREIHRNAKSEILTPA